MNRPIVFFFTRQQISLENSMFHSTDFPYIHSKKKTRRGREDRIFRISNRMNRIQIIRHFRFSIHFQSPRFPPVKSITKLLNSRTDASWTLINKISPLNRRVSSPINDQLQNQFFATRYSVLFSHYRSSSDHTRSTFFRKITPTLERSQKTENKF